MPAPGVDMKDTVSYFLGQYQATAQLREKLLGIYYLSVYDILEAYHTTSILSYTRRFIEQEHLDQSGVP